MVIGWMYSKQKIGEGKLNYKYYLPSLFIHLFGVTFFCLVYGFYYGGGDSYYYFRGGVSFIDSLFNYPFETIQIYFYKVENIPDDLRYVVSWVGTLRDNDTFFTMKLASIFCFLGFGGFLSACILLSYLSFYLNWKLFTTINLAFFVDKVQSPKLYYILFVPSLFFWGTGILKDTFVFIFTSCIIIIFIRSFNLKELKKPFFKLVFLLISIYSILNLKSYVLFTLLTSLFIAYYGKIVTLFSVLESNRFLKYLFNIFFFILLVIILVFGFQSFQIEIQQAQKAAISTLQGFHDWHTKLGGSSYSLGITDYSVTGILSQSPLAFLVTYFGPFPWQINSPIMLLTAVESYFYFYLFILTIKKRGIQLFNILVMHDIVFFSMIFTLIFGVLVGITSYNYGALARFKIQALPYFLIWVTSIKIINSK
tara:strand:- start:87 stop:1355 length:1269 start_codon:yes stop_codon:yes gene_type:complete